MTFLLVVVVIKRSAMAVQNIKNIIAKGVAGQREPYCCFCLRFAAAASSAIQLNCLYVNQR